MLEPRALEGDTHLSILGPSSKTAATPGLTFMMPETVKSLKQVEFSRLGKHMQCI